MYAQLVVAAVCGASTCWKFTSLDAFTALNWGKKEWILALTGDKKWIFSNVGMAEVTLVWMNAHQQHIRGDEANRKVRQIGAWFDFINS